MLHWRLKPYTLSELKAALRSIGRPLPYLGQLRRDDLIEQVPKWLTDEDVEKLVIKLEAPKGT